MVGNVAVLYKAFDRTRKFMTTKLPVRLDAVGTGIESFQYFTDEGMQSDDGR